VKDNEMTKAEILGKGPLLTNSGALKEEFLRRVGLDLSNTTTLRGVVKDLAGAGVSKKTLTIN
jgi:hypothetical protein